MLHSLGHDAVVCGNHQERQVDARNPRHHGTYEFLVAGHVDDANAEVAADPTGGESKFDGEPALLFFLEPVRIAAGQQADQTGLAVIHMPGRRHHHDDVRGLIRAVAIQAVGDSYPRHVRWFTLFEPF